MKLVFATNNLHKLQEIRELLSGNNVVELISLRDLNFSGDIPETSDTLEGNALEKALFVYKKFGLGCFADDTGLEIDALQGRPGIFSARYAGESKNSSDNIDKVLKELRGIDNRKARFRTVISLVNGSLSKNFEGIVNGRISMVKSGKEGFGYDPIFIPDGYDISFAEMTLKDKNSISHRAMALKKFIGYLNQSSL